MIMLHKSNSLFYCHSNDIKAIELVNNSLSDCKTRLILRLAGTKEVIYVKESPTYILRRMGEETKNSN